MKYKCNITLLEFNNDNLHPISIYLFLNNNA